MAAIYKFTNTKRGKKGAFDRNDTELLTPEEADAIHMFLEVLYPKVRLTEEESQRIYANIMRTIMKMENRKKG